MLYIGFKTETTHDTRDSLGKLGCTHNTHAHSTTGMNYKTGKTLAAVAAGNTHLSISRFLALVQAYMID
jgi:hypothetical protein